MIEVLWSGSPLAVQQQAWVPTAAGYGAAFHEVEGGRGCGGVAVERTRDDVRATRRGVGDGRQGQTAGALHVSGLRQVLHVEAGTQHAQAAALRQGAALPVSLLSQAVLPAGKPGQPHSERPLQFAAA